MTLKKQTKTTHLIMRVSHGCINSDYCGNGLRQYIKPLAHIVLMRGVPKNRRGFLSQFLPHEVSEFFNNASLLRRNSFLCSAELISHFIGINPVQLLLCTRYRNVQIIHFSLKQIMFHFV